MSRENIRLFFDEVAKDKCLLNQLKGIAVAYSKGPLTEQENDQLIEEILIPVANSAGFAFTLDELKDYSSEVVEEMSDKELDSVVAGVKQPAHIIPWDIFIPKLF